MALATEPFNVGTLSATRTPTKLIPNLMRRKSVAPRHGFKAGIDYPVASNDHAILYDGGMGTEIERRIPESIKGEAWCGLAHLLEPEAVIAIHEDFIDAGARINTTNTYATNRHVLETSNEDDNAADSQKTPFDVPEANIKAVEVAREAIKKQQAAGNKEKCWIAGSISNHPPFALR